MAVLNHRARRILRLITLLGVACAGVSAVQGQENSAARKAPVFEIESTSAYHVTYVKLGAQDREGLLYEPTGTTAPVAVVQTYPRTGYDQGTIAASLASRGYRVLLTLPYTEHETPFDGLPDTSSGVRYLRGMPGVGKVVVMGHSAGGRMMAFYADLALNGPKACQKERLIYRCRSEQASGLARPDGVILLDPAPGAINLTDTVDPAYVGNQRSRSDLDMFAAANGYDPKTQQAHYTADFRKRYFAAQSVRNMALIQDAETRLKALEQGEGPYADNAPLVLHGAVNNGGAGALFHADLSLMSHTRLPRMLLRADGSRPVMIVPSVRPADAEANRRATGSLAEASVNYTLRHFLEGDAMRTGPDFAMTEDDVTGVDWRSSLSSTPGSAEGITVPTLVLTTTCFQLLVTSEIAFDHLAAKDKTFVAVEGSRHNFTPCKPEYGDTRKHTFDFVAEWLAKPGRF